MTTDRSHLQEVLAIIKQHPAIFHRHYQPRIINNIYFDTPGMTSYFDHIAGAANREKWRVRWYGSPENNVDHPVLERKFKSGLIGGKLSEKLQSLTLDSDGSWPVPGRVLAADTTDKTVHWRLSTMLPQVAIRYHRDYFLSADAQFRMTVDTDLKYFGLSMGGVPQSNAKGGAPIIIEIKFDKENSSIAERITNQLPFRISRFSKYIYAIDGLRGHTDV